MWCVNGLLLLISISGVLPNLTVSTQLIGGLLMEPLSLVQFFQYSVPLIFEFPTPSASKKFKEQVKKGCKNTAFFPQVFAPWLESAMDQTPREVPFTESILRHDGVRGYQSPFRNHLLKLSSPDGEITALKSRIRQNGYTIHKINLTLLPTEDFKLGDEGCYAFSTYIAAQQQSRALLAMCQTKRLQVDFFKPNYFQQLLDGINQRSKKHNLTLAIPNFHSYFELPLVECSLGVTENIVVLHVPLLEILPSQPTLVQLLSPSFSWKTQICSFGIETTPMALLETKAMVRYFLPSCNPIQDDLCLITESYEASHPHILCLQKILAGGSASDLANRCPMSCKDAGSSYLVLSLAPSSFLVTNAPVKVLINCKDGVYIVENKDNYGTLRFDLPCSCKVMLSPETILRPQFPCVENKLEHPVVTRLIPAAWSRLDTIHIPGLTKKAPTFSSLSEIFKDDPKTLQQSRTNNQSTMWMIAAWSCNVLGLVLSLVSTGLWVYLFYHQYLIRAPMVIQQARAPPTSVRPRVEVQPLRPMQTPPATVVRTPHSAALGRGSQPHRRTPSRSQAPQTIQIIPSIDLTSTSDEEDAIYEMMAPPQQPTPHLQVTHLPPMPSLIPRPNYLQING